MAEQEIALVTGASKGIGAATALALAKAGFHVILTARNAKSLEKIEEQIFEAGGSATIAPVDISEPDGITRLAGAVLERWGRLDALIVNAAILPQLTSVADIDPKQFSQALTINVLATQSLIANFDQLLRKSPNPRVIGLTSGVAQNPRAFWGAYASSKAAFEVLLECYAQETKNISQLRIAILNPGATRTGMRAKAYPGEDPASVKAPEVVADRIVALLGEQFVSGHRETVTA
jgi:NAD(P)-dependent dehydrogenase (short-subunit alcohol dehydrogenase family)